MIKSVYAKKIILMLVLCLVVGLVACGNKENSSKQDNGPIQDEPGIESKTGTSSNILQEQSDQLKKCPNGVCEMKEATTESQCDEIAGRRDDRTEKCIDATLQEIIKEPSPAEKECKAKGGRYIGTGSEVGECIIVPTDAGKECVGPEDCMSGLCQVSGLEDKKGTCNAEYPFKGCGKFLAPNKKVINICR